MSGQYRTIVADPPWLYEDNRVNTHGKLPRRALPYAMIPTADIRALPVAGLAASEAHLYLWTTNRHLQEAFGVVAAWGFTYSQTLVWAKPPGGGGFGGAFAPTTEFILFGWRGRLGARGRVPSTWFPWPRTREHSRKPDAFLDLVEQVSPGPYLELFARRRRLNWDCWGNEVESSIEMAAD